MDYKISKFTVTEPLPDGNVGVFNTLTRALGILPADYWAEAYAGGLDQGGDAADLFEHGFVVDSMVDEELVLAHWRASQSYDVTHLTYFINPTLNCNMACSYCVHGQKTRGSHMDRRTARQVLDFIQKDIEAKNPLSVRLDFGGAEASLRPDVILYLAEGANRFCRGKGVEFKTTLISNGLALKPGFVRDMADLGLFRLRITVSGPADIHDNYRVSKSGVGTYERIMASISELAGLVGISIQGQYDSSSEEFRRFPELLEDMTRRGLRDAIEEVNFGPINPPQADQVPDGAWSSPLECLSDEDSERIMWLRRNILAAGYKQPLRPPANRCLINYRNSVVIGVDGQISICPAMMDFPEFDYGWVQTGVDFRKEARYLARVLPDKCRRDCAMAPLCDGGCRHQAFVKTGDIDGIHCPGPSFLALAKAYIKEAVAG